jgi:membrane protease subunit HflK
MASKASAEMAMRIMAGMQALARVDANRFRESAARARPCDSGLIRGERTTRNTKARLGGGPVSPASNWQIDPAKPEDYVFTVLNPRETVKAVAETIMREEVGLKTIDGILTTDRKSVETDVQKRMQEVLDGYRAGVLVKQVQLQSVDAPSQVISAYRDVTAAQQDQQRAVNEAETYANKVVPEAGGGAARIVAEAKAYREQTILEAKGQTARYNQICQQYKKAPSVTRERMYLETMERVLGPMDKTIVDQNSASPPVPYIALEPLQPKTGGAK